MAEPPRDPQKPIVFSCSGSADVGGISDGAARRLSSEGVAKMFCLAGVGARVERIMGDMQLAESLVSIDGCENDCSRNVLEAAGFRPALHIRITDLGMAKDATPITPERIQSVADEVLRRLREERAKQQPPPPPE
jgi:uncharacterized metal-binding protein